MKCSGPQEIYDIYNEAGEPIGRATRGEVHQNPSLVHRAVHVLVFNRGGELLLQKRVQSKDIEPGKWDTSVGGHLDPGEDWITAARREMKEELAVVSEELVHLYDSRFGSAQETEDIRTFRTEQEGPFRPNPEEIAEVRFFSLEQIRRQMGTGFFSRNFEEEIAHYFQALGRRP